MQQIRKDTQNKWRLTIRRLLCGVHGLTVIVFNSQRAHWLWKYLRTEEVAQSVFGRLSFWLCFLCSSLRFLFRCCFHRFACWLRFDFHFGGLWRRRRWDRHPFWSRRWLRYLCNLFDREQVWTWWFSCRLSACLLNFPAAYFPRLATHTFRYTNDTKHSQTVRAQSTSSKMSLVCKMQEEKIKVESMILSFIAKAETLSTCCSQWWLLLVGSPSGTIWQQKKEAVNDFKLSWSKEMYAKDILQAVICQADTENHRKEKKKLPKLQISHPWPLFFDKRPQLHWWVRESKV